MAEGRAGRPDFDTIHARKRGDVSGRVQRLVFGEDVGVAGYTTVAQADTLRDALGLGRGMRLLDVGCGQGWPGLHLARTSRCDVVLTDVPSSAMRSASRRASRMRLRSRCTFISATGSALPFRHKIFDAAVHTDVL